MSRRRPSSPSSRSRSEPRGKGRADRGQAAGLGVYLHLPFCLSKCPYCDFASEPLQAAGGLPAARRYLEAVGVELDLRAASPEFAGARVATLYIGGGTPTVLPAAWLCDLVARLRRRLTWAEEVEATVEANPGTVAEEDIARLLAAGVNRVSLGVQSFSDEVLRALGRAHTAEQARQAVSAIREAGCQNLSLDLIYGAPGQSLHQWQDTLEAVLACEPEHVSAYGLTIEPGTPLAEEVAARRAAPADEDLYAAMYALAAQTLEQEGYEHYEISNYARPGRQCRHNRGYWTCGEYLGLGAAAHTYRRGLRWNNWESAAVYTQWVERGVLPVAVAEGLGRRRRVGEMLMLGLRLAEGVAEEEVASRCGMSPREAFGAEIEQLCEQGLLQSADGRLRIPRDKWLVADEALSQFAA